jgi:hypothetical protein
VKASNLATWSAVLFSLAGFGLFFPQWLERELRDEVGTWNCQLLLPTVFNLERMFCPQKATLLTVSPVTNQ